jgi:hypothetical protein
MSGLPNDWPPGDLRAIYLHWTAGDYVTTYPAYHFCVGLDGAGAALVTETHDLRANMRDVRGGNAPYAAHTAGRNSFAIGIAVCGMRDATPHDFGAFPLRDDLVGLACETAARLCATYAIPVVAAHVRTHAEAALDDGYFGSGADERWDIARLRPSSDPLVAGDAVRVGDALRSRIDAAMRTRLGEARPARIGDA